MSVGDAPERVWVDLDTSAGPRTAYLGMGSWPGRVEYVRADLIEGLIREKAEAEANRDELQGVFDLIWKADMRAIQMWQEANPGNDRVWPDGAKLTIWLMGQLDKAKVENTRLRRALEFYADGC